MIQIILSEQIDINGKDGNPYKVLYYEVQGGKYISMVKIRGDRHYNRGDIFNGYSYDDSGDTRFRPRKYGVVYNGSDFASSIEEAERDILITDLEHEVIKRFKPCYIPNDQGYELAVYSHKLYSKGRDIYNRIITRISYDYQMNRSSLEKNLTKDQIRNILREFYFKLQTWNEECIDED